MLLNFIAKILPEGNLRHRLEDIGYIQCLPISDAGVSDESIPFVKLENGLIFYGYYPNKRQKLIYRLFSSRSFRRKVPEDAYNVAWDIWLRYWQDGHINQQRYYKLKTGDTVIEAGAYIGYYTLKMSQAVGRSGRVIAIEPVEENRFIIQKNIEANHIQNVTLLPYAVSNRKGKTVFYITDRQKNALLSDLLKGKGQVHAIPVTSNTIDNIIAETGIQTPNLIIITVNGAEIDALEGMAKTLELEKIHLVVAAKYLVNGCPTYKRVVDMLQEKGYHMILDHYGFVKNENPEQQAVIYASKKTK